MRRVLPTTLLLLALETSCFPRASVPDAERRRAERELEGQRRFTKVALWVGPFFGDDTKWLVSDSPFSELDLLETSEGKPIAPPPAQRVLLPGTPLVIEKVEFPTGLIIAKRVVMTPRYHPWVYLRAPGEPRPLVLVLPQTLASADEVRLELERTLGASDPTAAFQALPEEERSAIARKQPLEGMGPQALEMAWGYPEKKVIDRPAGNEEWSWADGRRKAFLHRGKLQRWESPREAG
jgi:hypothetical protein